MPFPSPVLYPDKELFPGEEELESRALFGENFIGPWQVEQAVISTLSTWYNDYLAELEVQNELHPKILPRFPAPESIHGGVNFETWRNDITPEAIVVVKPDGSPELHSSAGYTQGYLVSVGCLWVGSGSELTENPEDEARAVASYLGAATMLLVQQPTLGGLAERVVMTQSPEVTLPNPDNTRIAQVITSFEVWVSTIVEENAGPVQPFPEESPEYNGPEEGWDELPTADEVIVTVVGVKELS